MSLFNCPECGKEISDTTKSCPNCGYKLKKSKFNTKILISIPIIILVFILSFYFIRNITTHKDYWDNNKWGTTYSEIESKYKDKIYDSDIIQDSLAISEEDVLKTKGLNRVINFSFTQNESLYSVLIIYDNNSTKSNNEIISVLKKSLSKDFGSYQKKDEFYKWSTDNSDITLYQANNGSLIVEYRFPENKDVTTLGEQKASKESKESIKNLVNSMISYVKDENNVKLDDSYKVVGLGKREFNGNIDTENFFGACWIYEDDEYFEKLYPIFEEMYGKPDEEYLNDSVSWKIDGCKVLLQNNNGRTYIYVKEL